MAVQSINPFQWSDILKLWTSNLASNWVLKNTAIAPPTYPSVMFINWRTGLSKVSVYIKVYKKQQTNLKKNNKHKKKRHEKKNITAESG